MTLRFEESHLYFISKSWMSHLFDVNNIFDWWFLYVCCHMRRCYYITNWVHHAIENDDVCYFTLPFLCFAFDYKSNSRTQHIWKCYKHNSNEIHTHNTYQNICKMSVISVCEMSVFVRVFHVLSLLFDIIQFYPLVYAEIEYKIEYGCLNFQICTPYSNCSQMSPVKFTKQQFDFH